MTDPIFALLDTIERVKTELKLQDALLNELYLTHIGERQDAKKDYFVKKRLMEQKHEEETIRMESDILKIKADMDSLEKQLTGLMSKTEADLILKSSAYLTKEFLSQSPPSLSLPCPKCPVCSEPMIPPLQIFQCSNGHLVCQHCHAKLHVTTCRICMGQYVGRATGAVLAITVQPLSWRSTHR